MKKKLLSSVVATSVAASTLLLVPLSAQGAPPPAVNASATPVVDGGVVLSWPAAVGATAYKVEVAADPNFTTILESENVYGRSYTPRKYHGVDSPRTVYWRVAHYTNYTSESSLQPWSSTKEILYPAVSASSVGAPTAGQVLAYPDPVSFTWPVVKGAVSYELQYSADGNFQNSAALVTKTSTTNSFTPEEPLAQGAWAWRVRAKFDSSAKEKGNYSGWSPVVNFSVTWKPEDSRVKLLEPTGGKAYSDPLFSWEPVAGASYYKLTVARNVDFTGLILNEQEVYGTSYVHDDTFVNGQYYWKVVAYDSSGRAGASPTAPQQFVKRWGPQAGPINSGGVSDDASPRPLSGGTSAANATPMSVENLKLSWEPLQRATSYEVTLTPLGNPDLRPLVCRTASTSVTIVEHVGNGIGSPNLLKGDGTCFSTLENDLRYNAPSGATFLWRVQGIDYAGKASSGIQGTSPSGTLVSGLSEPRYVFVDRSRSTATVPYDESASTIQDTTAWSAQTDKGSASAPEFSWKPVTGANGYEVRIYRSSGITNHVATIRTPSTTVRSNGVFSDDNTGQSYEWRVIPYFKDTAGRIAYFSALWDLQPSLAWKRQTSALTLPDSYLEDRDGVNPSGLCSRQAR